MSIKEYKKMSKSQLYLKGPRHHELVWAEYGPGLAEGFQPREGRHYIALPAFYYDDYKGWDDFSLIFTSWYNDHSREGRANINDGRAGQIFKKQAQGKAKQYIDHLQSLNYDLWSWV